MKHIPERDLTPTTACCAIIRQGGRAGTIFPAGHKEITDWLNAGLDRLNLMFCFEPEDYNTLKQISRADLDWFFMYATGMLGISAGLFDKWITRAEWSRK